MTDPRVERLAELLVGYSLGVQAGQLVRIDGSSEAAPLIVAAHRAALRRGAHAYAQVSLDGIAELHVDRATEEQLTHVSQVERSEMERLDGLLTIWSESNTRSFTRAEPDRQGRYIAARRELSSIRGERMARGEMTWCGTLYPTEAHAQDAEMSLREYEDFVYRACHVADGDDPAVHWKSVAADLDARARELSSVRELRIVGPDTDLRLLVEGRTWLAAKGERNMPDGEVFTSPVEKGTEGTIRYALPAIFNGREVEDVRLRFEGGRVTAAEASHGGEYLNALLDMDGGSRILGEVAFGLNYEIDRFTRNILFDEKIGGTMHLALGSAFKSAGGENVSGLHWDMICDLRADGEVYADGELVWRAGAFTTPAPGATRSDAR